MRRRTLLSGLAGALGSAAFGGAALTGCTDNDRPRPTLSLATGEQGGVYRPLGRALAAAMQPSWRADALLTSASVDNLTRLAAGHVQVAFTAVDAAAAAIGGLAGFPAKFDVRALAGIYSDYVHLVIPTSISANDLGGLSGRPVSTGAPGSGTELVATRMMAAAGITLRGFEQHRLGLADSVAALRAGVVDAFFFSGGLPTPGIASLIAANDLSVRLLDLGGYVATLQSQFGEIYGSGWIPNSTYGVTSVYTVCIPNVLAVAPEMDDDTAYRLTRLLFGAKPELAAAHPEGRQLDPRSALATFPVSLHAGAERYYGGLKQP